MARVGFVGLGVMGGPMAGHLAQAGHEVWVYNRTAHKATAWCEQHHGQRAETISELVASHLDVVFACVGNDDDASACAEAAFAGMAPGTIYVDHTTTSAHLAENLAQQAQAKGLDYVDAPVSGGQAGAEKGTLTAMVGGAVETVERVRPLMACFAANIVHLGPSGQGQLCKMANQIAIAGVVQGLAEAVNFTKTAGLDPDLVLAAISKGAAQSWQMDNRWPTMVEGQYDFGFAVDWMRKDLGIALDAGRRAGAQLPLTALVDQFYAEVQALGGGRQDTSSLLRRLEAFKTRAN